MAAGRLAWKFGWARKGCGAVHSTCEAEESCFFSFTVVSRVLAYAALAEVFVSMQVQYFIFLYVLTSQNDCGAGTTTTAGRVR